MKLFISKAILICFLIGSSLSLALIFLVKFVTYKPSIVDDRNRGLACFAGLEFAIPIGLQLVLVMAGLFAFLNVFPIVQKNTVLSAMSFLLNQIILLVLTIIALVYEQDYWLIICYFLFTFVPWMYFYIKFRQKYG